MKKDAKMRELRLQSLDRLDPDALHRQAEAFGSTSLTDSGPKNKTPMPN
jgi:hypothetical protein